eukprot:6196809-Pleurochrysis_carterae.AAC.2
MLTLRASSKNKLGSRCGKRPYLDRLQCASKNKLNTREADQFTFSKAQARSVIHAHDVNVLQSSYNVTSCMVCPSLPGHFRVARGDAHPTCNIFSRGGV